MESKAYWANRFKILENSTYTDTKKAYEEITKVFDKSKKDIQSKIDVWLTRLADNNNVSYERAKEMLNKKELKEFKWDVEDYIKYGEENGLNQEWMKELENASARHHIDKLTALKTSLQAEYEKIYGKDEEITKKTIQNAYINRYNHTAYEIQKGFNIGFNFGEIDHNKLDKLIKKPWASDGSNFSDRIWTKKSQMVDTLYQEMIRNLISERPLKEVIETMTQYVDKSVSNAKNVAARLVMTESAYFASEGQKSCFKDLGVEEYEIVATLDDKTSDICQNMDGRHFKMSEYKVGETAPPFHVWCRSTTAPYFNDEFTKDDLRAARNGSGKTYYVPSSMTYKQWVDSQKSLQKVEKSGKISSSKANISRDESAGRPSAIHISNQKLNRRQEKIDNQLQNELDEVIVPKRTVKMMDLSALTAKNDVEYAMFTKNGKRLIIRGSKNRVDITKRIDAIVKEGYRWSGHTHAYENDLIASDDDKKILKLFKQECSAIYDILGNHSFFWN